MADMGYGVRSWAVRALLISSLIMEYLDILHICLNFFLRPYQRNGRRGYSHFKRLPPTCSPLIESVHPVPWKAATLPPSLCLMTGHDFQFTHELSQFGC